jgi:predicted nuclease with TOPRIM domain
MNTSFDTPVSSRENSSETTPNSSVGLHQKLDILISGNRDQRKAIDSLKAENETLRAQLETVVQDLSVLKEVQNTLPATITRTKMKLPPAVSVSYS